jgi:hypothetical protein
VVERIEAGESDRVREGDWTINVEGAEFTADGTLLLGLRFPVAADGRPIVIRLRGVERLFAADRRSDAGGPEVTGLGGGGAGGRGGAPAGGF